jgi:AcrR family transcriptional regulator
MTTPADGASIDESALSPTGRAVSGLAPLNDRRMQLILTAALDTLSDRGLSHARVGDIAAKAGVSTETLLARFGDRDAIAAATVSWVAAKVRLDPAILLTPHETPPARLERLVTAALNQALDVEALAVLRLALAEGWRRPAFAQFYNVEIRQPTLNLARLLAERFSERSQIQPECEDAFVTAFDGLVRGEVEPVMMGLSAAPDAADIKRRARAIARRLLRAFAPVTKATRRQATAEDSAPESETPPAAVG